MQLMSVQGVQARPLQFSYNHFWDSFCKQHTMLMEDHEIIVRVFDADYKSEMPFV
jgi:hypothetical protein